MRILWLLNICPPAVGKALGLECSVREGWITGALNRFLAGGREGKGRAGEDMELGICFPVDPLSGIEISEKRRLYPLTGQAPSAGEKRPERQAREAGREVWLYGFREDLKRPERYDALLENRFARILADFRPDLVHIFGTEFPHALAMERVFQHPERTLVGIQGLVGKCAESYMADLPPAVQKSVTLRDMLRKDSLLQQQKKFRIRGEREREILSGCAHVAGRTRFDREGTLAINPDLTWHRLNETMRA